MPVPPEHLDEIAASVAEVYREAEVALVRLLARHLKGDLDRDIPAPQWLTEKLAAVRALRAGAEAVVAGLTTSSEGAFRDAAARAYRSGAGSAVADLPRAWFPKSGIGQAAARAQLDNLPGTGAVESLAAAVHRDVGRRSSNILRDVVDVYRSVVTAAVASTVTGARTRREASQAAFRRFTDRGITSFVDRSGRRWQLSSYVEMAARTVTQRAAVQGQTDRLDALDVDLVSVSNHGQECEKCRPFEGKILRTNPGPIGRLRVEHATRDGEFVTVHVLDTLDGARRKGFQHPNCRHSVSAYLAGVSRLPEGDTADPDGDKARQQQRAIERRIRKWKVAEAGALDETAEKAARQRVAAAQADLREHLKANPKLKRLRYREQIGAGNIPPKGRDDAAGEIGLPVQGAIDGLGEPVRRARPAEVIEPEPTRQPGPGQMALGEGPLDNLDLKSVPDERLDELLGEHADDDQAVEKLLGEMDRRQAAEEVAAAKREANRARRAQAKERREAEQWQRFEELIDEGVDEETAVAEVFGRSVERQRRDRAIAQLRGQGYTGKGLDELARKAYRDHVYQAYLAAENATRGHMLTPAAQRAGVDPMSLFSGPESRARLHASDELKEWWDQHGRLTYDQWISQLLGEGPGFRGTAGDGFLR